MKKSILNVSLIIVVILSWGVSVNAQKGGNVPSCSDNQLSLKEVEGEADMGGKRYGNYVFTNVSSKPCRMSGYPRFVLLDRTGRIMRGVKITYDWKASDDSSKSSITLKPRQTAWFQVFYNDGMPFDLKKPVPTSSKVKITAPHTSRTFVIKSEINAYKTLQVSAVRSGLPQ